MPIPAAYRKKFPRALLFDWDNTLINSGNINLQAINAIFEHFKLPLMSWEDYNRRPPTPVRGYLEEHGLTPEEMDIAAKIFRDFLTQEKSLKSLLPFADAAHLLQWLFELQIPCGVVSNKEGAALRKEVGHLGWSRYFLEVIGSRDAHEDKPSAAPLLKALEHMQIEAGHDVWFVGDSEIDMLCARRAGCIPVAIHREARLPDGPVVEFESRKELHEHLMYLLSIQPPLSMGSD